jgi:hypothetical protein
VGWLPERRDPSLPTRSGLERTGQLAVFSGSGTERTSATNTGTHSHSMQCRALTGRIIGPLRHDPLWSVALALSCWSLIHCACNPSTPPSIRRCAAHRPSLGPVRKMHTANQLLDDPNAHNRITLPAACCTPLAEPYLERGTCLPCHTTHTQAVGFQYPADRASPELTLGLGLL